jgi:hypothetical protein
MRAVTAPDDLALLRAHEPVVRFTRGEHFRPMAVEPYVDRCSLWLDDEGTGEPRLLVSAEQLDVDRLVREARARPRDRLHLRYVDKPLDVATLTRRGARLRERVPGLGRLGSVGLLARFVDAGLRGSLVLRGRVPGATGATAQLQYREAVGDPPVCTYYGRVVREGGYACLQYWYFYPMNDWRSAFAGINEHESDWEMVTVYLAEPDDGGPPQPQWVAYSSHDYTGDDLRRRWDDPEVHRVGDHPVVFAGAGSHSGAFLPGDYLVQVQPRGRVGAVVRAFERTSATVFPWLRNDRPGVGIPFIDYARGDGESVGPGQPLEWTPELVDDATPWVRDYRGLWGLDTRDRLGGERAPAGPRYERDGSVRPSWADPLGWAGLHKVAPTEEERDDLLEERVGHIDEELAALEGEVEQRRDDLRRRRLVAVTLARAGSDALTQTRAREIDAEERAVSALVRRRADLLHERDVHLAALAAPEVAEPVQGHLRHAHSPYVPAGDVRERFLRVWSAVSVPLMLGVVVAMLFAPLSPLLLFVVVAVVAVLAVEAFARKLLLRFLLTVAVLVVTAVALWFALRWLGGNWRLGLAFVVGTTAVVLLYSAVRDLVRR